MEPASIIAGISALASLANATKPVPAESNSNSMLNTMQAIAAQQQQNRPQQMLSPMGASSPMSLLSPMMSSASPIPLLYMPQELGLGSSLLEVPSPQRQDMMPIFQTKAVV